MTIRATLFNLRSSLRGGGRATEKPIRAIEAKIVRSLKPNVNLSIYKVLFFNTSSRTVSTKPGDIVSDT